MSGTAVAGKAGDVVPGREDRVEEGWREDLLPEMRGSVKGTRFSFAAPSSRLKTDSIGRPPLQMLYALLWTT